MNDPIFVQTSKVEAYRDFWHLALLSDYEIVPPEAVNLAARQTYIFPTLDQNMMECLDRVPRPDRAAHTVFWNLERPDARQKPGVTVDRIVQDYRRGMDEIFSWVNDIWVSEKTIAAMDKRTRYVVLGGHPELVPRGPEDSGLDVVHIGQVTPRRERLMKLLEDASFKVGYGPGWGEERAARLRKARLMLGIDRVEGLHFGTPLRWAVAAAAGLPILQEEVPDPHPLALHESIIMVPYNSIIVAAKALFENQIGKDSKVACGAREVYCKEWTFRRGIQQAMTESR